MTWMEAKLFLREPASAFFTLVFPLIYLFMYGAISGNEPTPMYRRSGNDRRLPYPSLPL